jgi:hypothetical protein
MSIGALIVAANPRLANGILIAIAAVFVCLYFVWCR